MGALDIALGPLPRPPAGAATVVAFSGGPDSAVLLHLLRGLQPLRALHVDHGLHPDSGAWAAHCRRQCQTWGVPLTVLHVAIDPRDPAGPEAAARRARYAALQAALAPGDVLLTAHHAEDQAETFLLQALRGAGPAGLAGMPAVKTFGPGQLARPLLGVTRAALRAYAEAQRLDWLEDPANANPDLNRSYLRHSLWPVLVERWPAAAATLGRAAGWAAEAAELQRVLAEIDLAACVRGAGEALNTAQLQQLSPARQRNLLRHWLHGLGLPAPSAAQMAQILDSCLAARADARPLVRWPGAELRREGAHLRACSATLG